MDQRRLIYWRNAWTTHETSSSQLQAKGQLPTLGVGTAAMIVLPTSESEKTRIEMVRSFGLLDNPRPPQHDEVAALARELIKTRWGLVTLVDAERVWFSGAANHSGSESCRWASFCTHVIADPDNIAWVPDALEDFRLKQMGLVVNAPYIRFYAGAPVVVNGHAVGTVCVFDPEPHAFDPVSAGSLARLAVIVSEDLAARHRERALQTALTASADALIECNDHGVISAWSDGAEHVFGFSSGEALGRNVDLIIPEHQKGAHHHAFDQWRLRGGGRVGRRIELRACCKDGSLVDIELWMSVAHVKGVPHIHANIRDISERVAQAAALRDAIAGAEAANEAKTTFLTNMSHELRTPLNGVIGIVDLLAQTKQSAHQRELTSIIKASSDQLRRLIGDILDLARIEAGELTLHQAPLSLTELIQDIAGPAGLAAESKGVAIQVRLDPALPRSVQGDALRLKQVLTNLVGNAVKFTQVGTITIEVSRSHDTYRFAVSDTGIGFDAQQRETIFGRFQQADDTITRRFGGSGLGLAICSDLVDAMGGELDCLGVAGQGAVFWFSIPLDEVVATSIQRASKEDTAPALRRVLVVDDSITNRRVAELILQTVGIETTCAEDGDQAVDAYLSETFDVVLMDMMMPVTDGLAATRAIRKIESEQGRPRTPIIMLTANSLPQHIEESFEAGADLHLPKPMTPDALFNALGTVLGKMAMGKPALQKRHEHF